jgi:hypothetical protein
MSNNQHGPGICDCCQGISTSTPKALINRPGLPAIQYRIGTHGSFKRSMLARLSSGNYPALSRLMTRKDDDFSIALLDAWAVVSDVLTFYQERIANESYLRTAAERLSLLQMARLIGYQLSPGVAASAYLAFMMETAEGSPTSTDLTEGLKVNSTPGPDEKPQTYETVESITARPQWNVIRPRLSEPITLSTSLTQFYLEGQMVDVSLGDVVLIAAGTTVSDRAVKRVKGLNYDEDFDVTRIDLESIPDSPTSTTYGFVEEFEAEVAELEKEYQETIGEMMEWMIGGAAPTSESESLSITPAMAALFTTEIELTDSAIQTHIIGSSWPSEDLLALAEVQGWNIEQLAAGVIAAQPELNLTETTGIFVFRKRGNIFGYNAPKKVTYTGSTPDDPSDWDDWDVTNESKSRMYLDAPYDKVTDNGYVAAQLPGDSPEAYLIDEVVLQPRTDYGLSAKSTAILLASGEEWWDAANFSNIRGTTVFLESEQLELAPKPITDVIQGQTILLDTYYPYLKSGMEIILEGTPTDQTGVTLHELATIAQVKLTSIGFTELTLEEELDNSYQRISVKINANVAPSTHGETVSEVLGNGDATLTNQKFTLRQPPLTHVSASTPSGTKSTLEVRVNDILWVEVDTLYDAGPNDAVYITRLSDDGKTTVIFGDGVNGRLLPTGSNNVVAKYRKGIGLEGLVRAGQLDQPLTRPLGLKGVSNPIKSSGAADPESLADARQNAPLTVLTIDRVVSLQDFEDFTRAFAGIAKAGATWVWDGRYQSVFITVAGPKGAEVDPDSDLYENLVEAIAKAGDPTARYQVESYRKAFFKLRGTITVDQAYLKDKVLANVKSALRQAFAFEKRQFGQDVVKSEVIAVMQSVAGVVSVDLDKLYRTENAITLEDRLPADFPGTGSQGEIQAAELLLLDPAPIDKLEATQ